MMNNKQDELFVQRLSDLASMCKTRYSPRFTHFLDGRQLVSAMEYLSGYDGILAVAYGGFSEAERNVVGVFPSDIYGSELDEDMKESIYEMFDVCVLKITGSGFGKFNHRDILGSVLSLGIKREAVGDIFVTDEHNAGYICLENAAAGLLSDSLEFVARDKVKVTTALRQNIPKIEKKYSVISGTVASERLDCIVSLCTNLSREKSKQMIASGLVNVNHFPVDKGDFVLCEGDMLSIRGYGRFVVKELCGKTKKGRDRITVHKMI